MNTVPELMKRIICWRWKALLTATILIIILILNYWRLGYGSPKDGSHPMVRYLKLDNMLHQGTDYNETLEWFKDFQQVSQATRYCNPVETPVTGAEGIIPGMKKLISVHVLIRHGDRTPIHAPKKPTKVTFNCKMNLTEYPYHKMMHSFVDNMHRTTKSRHNFDPFRHIDTIPKVDICGYGQLTPKGVVQHLDLARFLSNVYNKELGLLQRNFPNENIHIRSTKTPRTYQSALAFLYGFLPTFRLRDITISEQPQTTFCNTKYFHQPCSCRAMGKYQRTMRRELKQQNRTLTEQLLYELSSKYNIKLKEAECALFLDRHMAEYCHKKPLDVLCVKSGACNATNLFNILWKVSNGLMKRQLHSISYQKFQLLSMHPLLYEVAHRMKMNTHLPDHRQVKFVLLSGHDVTMTPLLVALGIHDGKWPPYASRLVFEQYTMQSGKGVTHHVRVLFNGKDVTRKVRFCKKNFGPDKLCPLTNFMKFIGTEGFRRYFGVETFSAACQK